MPSAGAGVSRLWEALVSSLRRAGPALAGYAAVRVFSLLVFAAFAQRAGQPVLGLLGRHDGIHHRDIAEHGYGTGIRYDEGRLVNTNIAFFPLFPRLIRAATLLEIPSDVDGVPIATNFGLVAAWGMFEIGAGTGSEHWRVAGCPVGSSAARRLASGRPLAGGLAIAVTRLVWDGHRSLAIPRTRAGIADSKVLPAGYV